LEKERAQLNKRRTKIEELLVGIDNKLSNENFIANAPDEIVNRENNKKIDLKDELEKINSNIIFIFQFLCKLAVLYIF